MVYHCGFHPRLLGGLNAQFCFDVQRESIIIISWYFAWKWCKNGVPGSSTCNMSSISIQLIYHDVVILFPTSFFGIFMINMVNYVKKTIDHVKPYRWSWSRARPICLEGTNAPLNYSAKKRGSFPQTGVVPRYHYLRWKLNLRCSLGYSPHNRRMSGEDWWGPEISGNNLEQMRLITHQPSGTYVGNTRW